MKLLIIDTETTGTDKDSQCCEIAATLYQVGRNVRETGALISVSTLLEVKTNEAESTNNITPELTKAIIPLLVLNFEGDQPIDLIVELIKAADYCVAFNSEFDSEVIEKQFGHLDLEINWLCAMKDFDWGYPNKSKYGTFKLTDLALWLGIGVSFAHRAGDDVRLLVECFNRKKDKLPLMLEKAIFRANSPLITLKALVNYDNRQLANDAGFQWKPESKNWLKTIKVCDKEELLSAVNFECEVITNE